jgi:hypothetical protein
MNYLKLASGIAMAGMLWAACGDDDGGNGTPDAQTTADARPADAGAAGFPQPAGTVPVNFSVDDSANKVYAQGDLLWKGSFIYDPTTRKVINDSLWGGPYPPLYDDGPWTAGGHEPAGSTAGDHKWGVTIFVTPPASGSQTYEYGLHDESYQVKIGNGWVWVGTNGSFVVNSGATSAVTAQGMTFQAFGTTDLQVTVDTTMLGPGTWDTSMVRIKGSAWAWGNQTMAKTGDIWTFTLSDAVGPGKPLNHTGLLKSGDKPEWTLVFGPGDGKEYEDDSGIGITAGQSAGLKAMGAASFTPAPVVISNTNASVTVP